MENANIGGGKDQMPQDRRKEQDAGKKTEKQSQGGSSQNWQPHDDEETESRPTGGSPKNNPDRTGGQQYPGGQSSPSRQSGQSDQGNPSGPTSNPAK